MADPPRLQLKRYVVRLYLSALAVFVVNKLWLRPWILEHSSSEVLKVFVLSAPNAIEAIIGMTNTAGLLHLAKDYLSPRFDRIPGLGLYILATLIAGIYVITQELKIHNLGGNNTYDPNDLVASILGLVGMLLLFSRFGIAEGSSEDPAPDLLP